LTTPALFRAHEAFRQRNLRILPVIRVTLQRARRRDRELAGRPDAELVQVGEQVRRVPVYPVGAGPLQLVLAIAP